jgi:hypothetical protein
MGTIQVSKHQYGKLVKPDVETVAGCRETVFRARWPGGFYCEACWHASQVSKSKQKTMLKRVRDKGIIRCPNCRRDTSVLAGTVFECSRLPLPIWFRALDAMIYAENPLSTAALCKEAGMDRWQTAQHVSAKIRGLMRHPDELLDGERMLDSWLYPLPEYAPLYLWATIYKTKDRTPARIIHLRTLQFEHATGQIEPSEVDHKLRDLVLPQLRDLGPRVVTLNTLHEYLAEISFKLTYKSKHTRQQILTQRAMPPSVVDKALPRIRKKRKNYRDVSV